jgi:hypothetical protein
MTTAEKAAYGRAGAKKFRAEAAKESNPKKQKELLKRAERWEARAEEMAAASGSGHASNLKRLDTATTKAAASRTPATSKRSGEESADYRYPAFRTKDDARAMARLRLSQLSKQEMPPRQYETVVVLLQKVIDSGISEVGMSRTELHDRTGMPLDSARTALDYIARAGEYFTRTDQPKTLVNKRAQLRQRRRGYRPRYFYRLVDVDVAEAP